MHAKQCYNNAIKLAIIFRIAVLIEFSLIACISVRMINVEFVYIYLYRRLLYSSRVVEEPDEQTNSVLAHDLCCSVIYMLCSILQRVRFTVTSAIRGRMHGARIRSTIRRCRAISRPWWPAMAAVWRWCDISDHVSYRVNEPRVAYRMSRVTCHVTRVARHDMWVDAYPCTCSLRGGATHVYVTITNQFIHGRSRVHDGKFRQWTYVLLWGRYVQF